MPLRMRWTVVLILSTVRNVSGGTKVSNSPQIGMTDPDVISNIKRLTHNRMKKRFAEGETPFPYNTIYGIFSPPEGGGTIFDGRNGKIMHKIREVAGVTQEEFHSQVETERTRLSGSVNPDS